MATEGTDVVIANQQPVKVEAFELPPQKSILLSRPSIDFSKEYKNGHKAFNSTEARAMSELMHTEESTRERYQRIKAEIKRPRNPLMGESTPRDFRGSVVMNPKMLDTVNGGTSLFTREQIEYDSTYVKVEKSPIGKIGVPEQKYSILGNTLTIGSPAQAEDFYQTVSRHSDQKKRLKEDQDKIQQFIAREKAKRYQVQLSRQLLVLKKQIADKSAELDFVKTRYGTI